MRHQIMLRGFEPLALFNDVFDSTNSWNRRRNGSITPAIDVHELEGKYVISVDVPGYEKDQIKLSIDDNVLTISAERVSSEKKDGSIVERQRGAFSRRVRLPDNIDEDQVVAKLNNGVLEVSAGKKKADQPRLIEIAA